MKRKLWLALVAAAVVLVWLAVTTSAAAYAAIGGLVAAQQSGDRSISSQVYLPFVAAAPRYTGIVSGVVYDASGPLPGARLREQTTNNTTLTDQAGRFTLNGLQQGVPFTLSAWKDGYYSGKVDGVVPPTDGLTVTLHLYQTDDNPEYEWLLPTSCTSCKAGITNLWLENDVHAKSAANKRFLTMYNGTDVDGNQSPPTRYICTPDYGCFPRPPDPNQPYYGPGYKLDFPETAGNCAACHTPGPAVDAPYSIDPNQVSGADTFGIHCDFCHKIAAVSLDPVSGLPYANMPGVISMDIRRPFLDAPHAEQLFFGTFDDVNADEGDTYLPLLEESQYCAPCHFGVFWDTLVYNSFGEWLESPYSDAANPQAQTCQKCHMPAPTVVDGSTVTNIAPGHGGVERDPLTIHAHTFPGAASETLLQNAVTMTSTTQVEGGKLVVRVSILNDQTGHHVPTDSPLRQMILLVEARDEGGQSLTLLDGTTVPDWGGVGDPAQGYYAGLPGTAYAKILEELWTGVIPTGAYWNQTRLVSDNRIPAFGQADSAYTFVLPVGGATVDVDVRLLFRRAFIQLADQKSWDAPDILMEQQVLRIQAPD